MALEVGLPDGRTTTMVVRRHGGRDRRRNPNIAADEFKLLQLLQSAGLPVPKPYAVDQSRAILSTPYLVVEHIEGESRLDPAELSQFVDQIASALAAIHRVDRGCVDLSFLPKQDDWFTEKLRTPPETLDDSVDEGRVREKLSRVWPLTRRNESVLLHGDFWPGNLIWRDGKLAGVIDWEDAAVGDPLADLANCRLELLWAGGMNLMLQFTHHYRSAMPGLDYTNLPFWDLCADLRLAPRIPDFNLDAATERTMKQRHRSFIAQALAQLSPG